MNKTFAVLCLLLSSSAYAGQLNTIAAIPANPPGASGKEFTKKSLDSSRGAGTANTIEARAAAFLPTGDRFRDVYGNVGVSLQIESARILKKHHNIGVWENLEWIFMDGKSLPSHGSTKIDILNLSAGVKFIRYSYKGDFLLNAAIGPDVGFVFIENKLRCCTGCDKPRYREHKFKAAIGGIVKTSAQYFIAKNFYFDLFADYLYLPVHFGRTENCGGFKLGAALGGRF